MQRSNFTENKPANEYRKGRFVSLLTDLDIKDNEHVDEILVIYDRSLADNLELKHYAYEVLELVKQENRKIAVITEGPHDAQELTLKRLGLYSFVNNLITSSLYETSKTDGLFDIALEKLECKPSEMLYVGDNPLRDYDPAIAIGIPAILLQEDGNSSKKRSVSDLSELPQYFTKNKISI